MIRTPVIIIMLFGVFNCFSQQYKDSIKCFRHNVAFQMNPAFDELNDIYYPVESRKLFAYAFRYGYNIHPNFKIGPEFSGSKREHFETVSTLKFSVIKVGAFCRFTINKLNFVRPFLETSAYYYYCNTIINMGYYEENSFGAFRAYFAPGLSFCLFKNRISIDIMYKCFDEFVNGREKMISYRLTYNFNVKGC